MNDPVAGPLLEDWDADPSVDINFDTGDADEQFQDAPDDFFSPAWTDLSHSGKCMKATFRLDLPLLATLGVPLDIVLAHEIFETNETALGDFDQFRSRLGAFHAFATQEENAYRDRIGYPERVSAFKTFGD